MTIPLYYRIFKIKTNNNNNKYDQVPFHDDTKLRDWMYEVYKQKDEMLGEKV